VGPSDDLIAGYLHDGVKQIDRKRYLAKENGGTIAEYRISDQITRCKIRDV